MGAVFSVLIIIILLIVCLIFISAGSEVNNHYSSRGGEGSGLIFIGAVFLGIALVIAWFAP